MQNVHDGARSWRLRLQEKEGETPLLYIQAYLFI